MRRSASEIIKNLMLRVARLERQSSNSLTGTTDTVTVDKNEVAMARMLVRDLEKEEFILVFLKCLSLKRHSKDALKLSKFLKINPIKWQRNTHIQNISNKIRVKDIDSLCRTFAQANFLYGSFMKESTFDKLLKMIGVSLSYYESADLKGAIDLLYPGNNFKPSNFDYDYKILKSEDEIEYDEEYDSYDEILYKSYGVRLEGELFLKMNANRRANLDPNFLEEFEDDWDNLYDLYYDDMIEFIREDGAFYDAIHDHFGSIDEIDDLSISMGLLRMEKDRIVLSYEVEADVRQEESMDHSDWSYRHDDI